MAAQFPESSSDDLLSVGKGNAPVRTPAIPSLRQWTALGPDEHLCGTSTCPMKPRSLRSASVAPAKRNAVALARSSGAQAVNYGPFSLYSRIPAFSCAALVPALAGTAALRTAASPA